jgi:tetratricopeptide (TPR) repeat protein
VYEAADDPIGVGWASARLVMPLLMQARHDEAERTGRAALETLEPFGEGEELANALHYLGWYLWRRGRADEAEPLLRTAVDLAERVEEPRVQAE